MRSPKSNLIYADFIVQMIMQVIIIACAFGALGGGGESIFISLLVLMPLGIWQVCSSLYTYLALNMKSRQRHLVITIAYFLICYAIYVVFDIFRPKMEPFIFVVISFIAAEILAIYYTGITYQDYLKYLNKKEMVSLNKKLDDDDILDAEMVNDN